MRAGLCGSPQQVGGFKVVSLAWAQKLNLRVSSDTRNRGFLKRFRNRFEFILKIVDFCKGLGIISNAHKSGIGPKS